MSEKATIVQPFGRQGNFTVFDNVVLDHIMPAVSPSAWKVLCFVIRKTVGWHKDDDDLSLSQIMSGAGLARATTMKAIKELEAAAIIIVTHTTDGVSSNNYRLNRDYQIEVGGGSSESELVQNLNGGGSSESELGVVQNLNTQNKGLNKDFTTTTTDAGEIFELYRNEIGMVSSIITDDIKAFIVEIEQKLGNDPPAGETLISWFTYAVTEAVGANVREWRYVKSILEKIIRSGSLAAHKLKRGENGQASNTGSKSNVNGKAAGTGNRRKPGGSRTGQAGLSRADAFQRREVANLFGGAGGGQD